MPETTSKPLSVNELAADWQLSEARDLLAECRRCEHEDAVDELTFALESGLRTDVRNAVDYARRMLGVVCRKCGVEVEDPPEHPTWCRRCYDEAEEP